MHQYRVTKHNPQFRDAGGVYIREDWTSFSDIGSSFGGVIFREDEYLRVESAYVAVAMCFLDEDGAPMLRAWGVENRVRSTVALTEGSLVPRSDLPTVCRLILREEFWCRLEAGGRFLHFGYDYYMYVGVKKECACSIETAHEMGLFVEKFPSPYYEAGKHC